MAGILAHDSSAAEKVRARRKVDVIGCATMAMMKRATALAIVVSLTGGCGAEPVRSTPPEQPAVVAPDVEPLPAGLYWTGYKTCEACQRPAAMTAAVAKTLDHARDLARRAAGKLPVGYPFVVHTDQLASSASDGIAVIFGLHASDADADRWLAHQQQLGLASAKYAISDDPPTVESRQIVTQVIEGAAVAAYRPVDVEVAERAAYEAQQWPSPEEVGAGLEPACTLEAGSIFVAEEVELEWYRWAPVRCGEGRGLIPWRHSRLGNAVVIRRGDGHVLRQVTAVDCDSPSFQEWAYSRGGKAAESSEVAVAGGC
jgi:hypothetical protein